MTLTTTTLVSASAQMVQITTLARGDVYKRLNTTGYSGPELRIGIVTDVMHNGTDAAIVGLEWAADGMDPTAKTKTFASGDTPSIFAATPEEAVAMFGDVERTSEQRVEAARRALAEAEATGRLVQQVRLGLPMLTAPVTIPVSEAQPAVAAGSDEAPF